MGGRKDDSDADRFLLTKRDIWYYQRRVPLRLRDQDERAPLVRVSLQTKSIAEARQRRNAYEAADNQLWGAMTAGDDISRARHIFSAAVRRAEAMGFSYQPAAVVADLPLDALIKRMDAIADPSVPAPVEAALLGGKAAPPTAMTEVLRLYSTEIATGDLMGKSPQQRRKWINIKKRAVARFIGLVSDKDISAISRDDALVMWRFWQKLISPATGKATHTPSSGNREMGTMREIYDAYFAHMGEQDRINPFAGLSFKEKAKAKVKRKRPPFSTEWIRDKILQPHALDGLNDEAAAIILATIETGARPSETCNLLPEMIRLDAPVPHLSFEEREDAENPRELKSAPSIRIVPLVGVALEVYRRYPNGFPRYREREEAASALINKFMRNNGLAPTARHTLYGLRHSLEDRMKDAGLGDDLRRILMGHKIDREEYGVGGSLKWRQDELAKIALPFDPSVIPTPPDTKPPKA